MPMWCMAPLEMNEGNSLGQGYNRPTGCNAEKAPHVTFDFFFLVPKDQARPKAVVSIL